MVDAGVRAAGGDVGPVVPASVVIRIVAVPWAFSPWPARKMVFWSSVRIECEKLPVRYSGFAGAVKMVGVISVQALAAGDGPVNGGGCVHRARRRAWTMVSLKSSRLTMFRLVEDPGQCERRDMMCR